MCLFCTKYLLYDVEKPFALSYSWKYFFDSRVLQ